MDIERYIKLNKDIVVELDDEVEYLIDDNAVQAIKKSDKRIPLKRLIDGKFFWIDLGMVARAIDNNGIVDYLDKKKAA